MPHKLKRRARLRIRLQCGASNITEFSLVFVVLIMIIFPLIDLCGLACGYATLWLATFKGVTRAAEAPDFQASLDGMEEDVMQVSTSGLGQFMRLKAVGGFRNCGSNLFTLSTNVYNSQLSRFGPNLPPAPPINSTSNVYEFQTQTIFDVGPLISMASMPVLSSIPGLGKPARLTCVSTAAVEHPVGLTVPGSIALSGGTSALKLLVNGLETPGTLTECTDSGWNYPQIYQLIAAAGQTVIEEDVLQVYANNSDWTDTGIEVQPGQKVWIDLRSDGTWTLFGGAGSKIPYVDADGYGGNTCGPWGLTTGILMGRMGSNTPFEVGRFELNLAPPGTGRLALQMNDYGNGLPQHSDNSGMQTVRIIVTQ